MFGSGPEWKSGSIYLFIMNDDGTMLYNGANQAFEGTVLQAIDRGDRDVLEVITDAVAGTPSGASVQYCWDDPTVEGDDEPNANAMMAPGFSWKISYVVNPFDVLGSAGARRFYGYYLRFRYLPENGHPTFGMRDSYGHGGAHGRTYGGAYGRTHGRA